MILNNGQRQQKEFGRISFLAFFIFVLSLLLIFRLFNLQVLQGSFYAALASGQYNIYKDLNPKRGDIFLKERRAGSNRELFPIATSVELNLVYAVPKFILNPKETAKTLAPILDLSEEELAIRLSKLDDPYEPLAHQVPEEKVEQVKALDLEGVGFIPETARFYPEKSLFSHVSGFLGYVEDNRVGQYGLEGFFDNELAGKRGKLFLEKDMLGNWIPTGAKTLTRAENGSDLVLTLDRSIQFMALTELKKAIEKYGARSGTVIIMEPKTGAILALSNWPDFDPNDYSKVDNIGIYKNQAIAGAYEPGSIFKVITMAAGLDAGRVNPETEYKDEGEVKFADHTIRNSDHKAHGIQTMTQVLEKSLNTGAVFVMRQVGAPVFKKYVEDFGFGSLAGIEMDGEANGDISSLSEPSEIYPITASFGQGISVTPIQMLTAFGSIANQGLLVKPYIVAKIIKPDGTVIETETKPIRQVISPKSAIQLKAMLVSVIRNGHGKKAGVAGYYVGGKTGTAQVPKRDGRGYSDETIHSFIGFAPVDNPVFVALIKLDNPRAVKFAADSTTVVFSQIAQFMLQYYGIPPTEH